ncbi:hypothetical protein [Pandoraea sp. SD6-2]|uniref:hypothetical protein n=1 Tax=Pandoraea sp. SD6-2 TaxID=1286093 RepID=UPI00032FE4AA|nr:hypothetical protein [Pandoraea sp. SD6-2]EON13125.1 hypothetical protein C266_13974 [Pandoraea sp. SD6-2]
MTKSHRNSYTKLRAFGYAAVEAHHVVTKSNDAAWMIREETAVRESDCACLYVAPAIYRAIRNGYRGSGTTKTPRAAWLRAYRAARQAMRNA